MPRVNKSRYAIMGMLSIRPMSGYDIKQMIEQSISYFWDESFGQIYPMLKKLVDQGLATRETEAQEGKPNRHVYTLTGKGLAELREWLSEPASDELIRHERLLKLFFGQLISAADNIRHVERERQEALQLQQELAEIEAHLKSEKAGHPSLPYFLITINCGKHAAQAKLNWCNETLDTLRELAQNEGDSPP